MSRGNLCPERLRSVEGLNSQGPYALLLAWGALFGSPQQQPPTGMTALPGIQVCHNLTDEAVCQGFLCSLPDGFRVALCLMSPQPAGFWQHSPGEGQQPWALTEATTDVSAWGSHQNKATILTVSSLSIPSCPHYYDGESCT